MKDLVSSLLRGSGSSPRQWPARKQGLQSLISGVQVLEGENVVYVSRGFGNDGAEGSYQ